MEELRQQNKLLTTQNVLLVQIVAFITPVSAFFAALKNFVVFMAWILGLITAAVAVWHGFVTWIKGH